MNYIVSQFSNPRGVLGSLVGWALAVKNRERIEWSISELHFQKTDHILEIGFGPGVGLALAAEVITEGRIAGIEISQTMIEQARKRLLKYRKTDRVELQHGSVESLPYPDKTFDKVFTINSMMFWPNPIENLREIQRVLKPNGLVAIIQQPRSAKTGKALEEKGDIIVRQIAEAGFEDITRTSKPMKPVTCLCIKGIRRCRSDYAACLLND